MSIRYGKVLANEEGVFIPLAVALTAIILGFIVLFGVVSGVLFIAKGRIVWQTDNNCRQLASELPIYQQVLNVGAGNFNSLVSQGIVRSNIEALRLGFSTWDPVAAASYLSGDPYVGPLLPGPTDPNPWCPQCSLYPDVDVATLQSVMPAGALISNMHYGTRVACMAKIRTFSFWHPFTGYEINSTAVWGIVPRGGNGLIVGVAPFSVTHRPTALEGRMQFDPGLVAYDPQDLPNRAFDTDDLSTTPPNIAYDSVTQDAARRDLMTACMNPQLLDLKMMANGLVERAARTAHYRTKTEIVQLGLHNPGVVNAPTKLVTLGNDLLVRNYALPQVDPTQLGTPICNTALDPNCERLFLRQQQICMALYRLDFPIRPGIEPSVSNAGFESPVYTSRTQFANNQAWAQTPAEGLTAGELMAMLGNIQRDPDGISFGGKADFGDANELRPDVLGFLRYIRGQIVPSALPADLPNFYLDSTVVLFLEGRIAAAEVAALRNEIDQINTQAPNRKMIFVVLATSAEAVQDRCLYEQAFNATPPGGDAACGGLGGINRMYLVAPSVANPTPADFQAYSNGRIANGVVSDTVKRSIWPDIVETRVLL